MSANIQDTQTQATTEAPKQSDKDYNFERIRRQLDQERQEKLQLKEEVEKLKQSVQAQIRPVDEDDDSEPYVDNKKLNRKLSSFEKTMDAKIEQKAAEKAKMLVDQERQQQWMRNNPDFYEVMQHAQTLADRDPELAETILSMPEGFERQKLVYKSIKAIGIHKKEEPKPSIQDKIDQNKRSPYYQPSGVGSAPYAAAGDFSPSGQKNAYAKMQELKSKLRI